MLWRKNARRSSRPKNCTFPRTGQTGSEYDIDIAKAAKTISHAFEVARWEDEKEETPVQAGFEITIYPPFEGEPKRIPENSVLVGSSRAFGVLGLNLPLSLDGNQAPQITWGQLRQARSRPERVNIPWMDKLENQRRPGSRPQGAGTGRRHVQEQLGRPHLSCDPDPAQALQE